MGKEGRGAGEQRSIGARPGDAGTAVHLPVHLGGIVPDEVVRLPARLLVDFGGHGDVRGSGLAAAERRGDGALRRCCSRTAPRSAEPSRAEQSRAEPAAAALPRLGSRAACEASNPEQRLSVASRSKLEIRGFLRKALRAGADI